MKPTTRVTAVAILLAGACTHPPPAVPPTPPAQLAGPLRLFTHNHRAAEVLVFESGGSRTFVEALLSVIERANRERTPELPSIELTVLRWRRDRSRGADLTATATPVRRIPVDTRYDVWLQDAAEIGAVGRGADARLVLLDPHRRGGLQRFVPELARRWAAIWVRLERDRRAASNGTGNVEALPGDVLLLGSTAGPNLERFLLGHGYADRHVRVDTSWLRIGHVDEVISHVITGAGDCGFALVRASPGLGLALARGDPQAPWWLQRRMGTAGESTHFTRVQESLEARIEASVAEVRRAVETHADCARLPVIALPALFECNGPPEAPRRCWSSLPNPVNLTVIDRHVVVPDPVYLPFSSYVDEILRAAGQEPHLLEATFYHQQLGGVHCATNVRRDPQHVLVPALAASGASGPERAEAAGSLVETPLR